MPDLNAVNGEMELWNEYCEQLQVHDRVNLVLRGSEHTGLFNAANDANPEERQPKFSAWVDSVEENQIVLRLRLEQTRALGLQDGEKLTFRRAAEDGIWIYEGVIRANEEIRLVLSRPLRTTRIQRREFCRVRMERSTRFTKTGETPEVAHRGVARNISGGGIHLAVKDQMEVGELLRIDVPLENEVIQMQGVVRRVSTDEDPANPYAYALGIEFVEPVMIEQDKIIGFVFTRQLQLRRQREEE